MKFISTPIRFLPPMSVIDTAVVIENARSNNMIYGIVNELFEGFTDFIGYLFLEMRPYRRFDCDGGDISV